MTEERVIFKNEKGEKLVGILHKPDTETKSIILMLHSFKGHKDYQPIFKNFPRELCKQGIAVLRFDCRGSGESDGEFVDFTIESEVEDLKTAVEYVKSLGFENIGLVGLSLGTVICILGWNQEIKTMVLWSPVLSSEVIRNKYKKYEKEFQEKGFIWRTQSLTGKKLKMGKKLYESYKKVNIESPLKKVTSPIFIIATKDDEIIEAEKIEKNASIIKNKTIKLFNGEDHNFYDKENEKQAIKLTIDWFKMWLK